MQIFVQRLLNGVGLIKSSLFSDMDLKKDLIRLVPLGFTCSLSFLIFDPNAKCGLSTEVCGRSRKKVSWFKNNVFAKVQNSQIVVDNSFVCLEGVCKTTCWLFSLLLNILRKFNNLSITASTCSGFSFSQSFFRWLSFHNFCFQLKVYSCEKRRIRIVDSRARRDREEETFNLFLISNR